MKTKWVLLLVLAMSLAITCFARMERWPVTQKPELSLAQAEAIGDKTMEQKYKEFFCIASRFTMLGDTDQEWELSYTNTKGERKWVIVDEKRNATLLDAPRDL